MKSNDEQNAESKKIKPEDQPWECLIVQWNHKGKLSFDKSEQVIVQPKDFLFHLNLTSFSQLNSEVHMANHIVGINDKLSSLIKEWDSLYQARFLPLYEGRHLQQEKTFLENNIQDQAKIVLIGNQQIRIGNPSLKFYHRFPDFKTNDDWSVGSG